MSDLIQDYKNPKHSEILRNVVERKAEEKKQQMLINSMADVPFEDLSKSDTSSGKNTKNSNCMFMTVGTQPNLASLLLP